MMNKKVKVSIFFACRKKNKSCFYFKGDFTPNFTNVFWICIFGRFTRPSRKNLKKKIVEIFWAFYGPRCQKKFLFFSGWGVTSYSSPIVLGPLGGPHPHPQITYGLGPNWFSYNESSEWHSLIVSLYRLVISWQVVATIFFFFVESYYCLWTSLKAIQTTATKDKGWEESIADLFFWILKFSARIVIWMLDKLKILTFLE